MKKNKIMRFASLVLVLTLLSTCAISGTFAKYTTSDSATDSARVAKFGVVVTAADNSNFQTEYDKTDSQYSSNLSVKSSSEDKLVAPGTKDENGIHFSISGTPEVAVKVDIAMNVTSDVFLKGTSESDAYYPVKFTLKQTSGVYKYMEDEQIKYGTATEDNPFVVVNNGTLSEVEAAVEAASTYVNPNKALDSSYVLTWVWEFDNENHSNDENDTILGNLAYNADFYKTGETNPWTKINNMPDKGSETAGTYSTSINYDITFTVTQVD